MRIAITGASGLVGTAVSASLRAAGHSVTRVVRSREAAEADDAVYWRPSRGEIDRDGIAGHDAVINLAGENIFGIWTEAKKRRIRDSRVNGTRLMAETIAGLDDTVRPAVLIHTSGVDYYGDRPADQPMTEDGTGGDTFLARVCQAWEAAAEPAREAGVRVVALRSGLVLDPDALLLQAQDLTTRLGAGATFGDGRQVFPWVTLQDIAGVIRFVLDHEEISGPVNVVGREKVTNEEFADTVARVLRRPRALRVPAFALRMLGDLGELLLGGRWVVPEKLETHGYEWRDPALEPALRRMLGEEGKGGEA
jgi:uncharacterized protein (TIGR01777 family)